MTLALALCIICFFVVLKPHFCAAAKVSRNMRTDWFTSFTHNIGAAIVEYRMVRQPKKRAASIVSGQDKDVRESGRWNSLGITGKGERQVPAVPNFSYRRTVERLGRVHRSEQLLELLPVYLQENIALLFT